MNCSCTNGPTLSKHTICSDDFGQNENMSKPWEFVQNLRISSRIRMCLEWVHFCLFGRKTHVKHCCHTHQWKNTNPTQHPVYAKRTTSHILLFPGCPTVLVAVRLQHRHRRIRHQILPKNEVTNLLQETGADHLQKTQKQDRKRDGNRDSDDRLRDLPEWLDEFTDNVEDTEVPAPAHISRDSDSERLKKVASKSRLTSQKTVIAKSACEPELQGHLAEDALEKFHLEQKILVTW